MILVLNGADFSANNLGQVEIDLVLDEFTEAAIAASGNTSLTDIQKAKLNQFFRTLGAFGDASAIWSKLSYIWLPMLAGDLAHSLVNYKDNTVSATPDSSQFSLVNNGIKAIVDNASQIDIVMANAPNKADLSLFAMGNAPTKFMRIGSSSSARYGMEIRKISDNSYNFRLQRDSASGAAEFEFSNAENVDKVCGISIYGSSANNGLALTSNAVIECSVTLAGGDINANLSLMRNIGSVDATADGNVRMLAIGSHLTASEMSKMQRACNVLKEALVG